MLVVVSSPSWRACLQTFYGQMQISAFNSLIYVYEGTFKQASFIFFHLFAMSRPWGSSMIIKQLHETRDEDLTPNLPWLSMNCEDAKKQKKEREPRWRFHLEEQRWVTGSRLSPSAAQRRTGG